MADKVGFVGLGNMGGPMARNLLKAGIPVVVHDLDPRKVQSLSEAGAEVAASAQAVANETTRSICMVETTAQAESVILGERGLIHGARGGHIVICMSTVDPFKLRAIEPTLAARGITLLDAPVSGGTVGARDGTLSILVGGDKVAFAACEALFNAMGGNVFHGGALGSGLAMKLINNMLLHVNTVAVAEGLVMAAKAGLDMRQVFEMVSVSSGNSFAFQARGSRMISRDFTPSGTVDISYKDQELETSFAKQLGVPVLLANVSQQMYQMARAAGFNKEEGSAVVKVYERLAGVTIGEA
jgi:3-hydroxyisobutyrate dehydrogenase-like beta-hydroxyacid dehydrogenase